MSLYTPWAPTGLSPRSNASEASVNRDASWPGERNAGLVRLAMNLSTPVRQAPAPAHLPGLHDLVTTKRLPPPAMSNWTSITPSDPSFYCHSLSLRGSRGSNVSQALRNSSSPHAVARHFAQPVQGYRHLSRGSPNAIPNQVAHGPRASDVSTLSPAPSPPSFYSVQSSAAQTVDLPRRSKAALAAEDWDHPSFARPPHKAVERKVKVPEPCRGPVSFEILNESSYSTLNRGKAVEAEPLVPNSYPVPPPPPYEQSAAPLADLASEMVWERCLPGKPRTIASPPSFPAAPWDSTFPWSTSRTHIARYRTNDQQFSQAHPSIAHHAPSSDWTSPANMFGVIGAEAKARKFFREHSCSVNSSPPPVKSSASVELKKLCHGTKTEVKPAFRRWTRQVLEQTLLSPQVLILALYYIDSVAGLDVFGDHNAKASLLPYKTLLAALVLANKTLDDHSYKNSTFANVSSMTTAEVNVIEVALLKALNFSVVPTSEQWSKWLGEVTVIAERAGFNLNNVGSKQAFSRLTVVRSSNSAVGKACDNLITHSARPRSIFDETAASPDFDRQRLLSDEANQASVWGRMTYQHDPAQQGHTLPQDNRAAESHHNHPYSRAEIYRDQLRNSVTLDLGFNPDFNHTQRAYPIFG